MLFIIPLVIWLAACTAITPTPEFPPFIVFVPATNTPSPTSTPVPDNWMTGQIDGPAIVDVSIYPDAPEGQCQSVKVSKDETFGHTDRLVYATKFSTQEDLEAAWATHVPVVISKPEVCYTFENVWSFDEWVQKNHPGY